MEYCHKSTKVFEEKSIIRILFATSLNFGLRCLESEIQGRCEKYSKLRCFEFVIYD